MPTRKNPRFGTMQFWPRKRAKKQTGLVRSWAERKDPNILGFAGYKAGMMHLIVTDNSAKSTTKGQDIQIPVTVIECPPLKAFSIRYYKSDAYGKKVVYDKLAENIDKELKRKITIGKNKETKDVEFDDVVLVVHTQPKLTGIGKKKPEIFEVALAGSKEDKIKYAQDNLGKEIKLSDVFKEGEQVDVHAVTKGRGFLGVVKRFGVSIKQHKAEKAIRTSSPAGSWNRENQTMWRNPGAGKDGYYLRTHYNHQIIKISDDLELVTPKAGINRFGVVKNTYILLQGSVPGPKKRIVRFNHAIRANKKVPSQAPGISYAHTVGL